MPALPYSFRRAEFKGILQKVKESFEKVLGGIRPFVPPIYLLDGEMLRIFGGRMRAKFGH